MSIPTLATQKKGLLSLLFFFVFSSFLFAQKTVIDSIIMVEFVSIHFDSDSSNIKPVYADSIKNIFDQYRSEKTHKLKIEAHTDSIGSIKYNKALSDRRAQSAFDLLIGLGVDTSGISIVGHGELKPIESNRSEEGRSKNRRVDVAFYTVKRLAYLNGKVVSDSTGIPVPATLILRSKDFRDSISTDSSGRFRIATPVGEVVVLEATAKDHFFVNKTLKITPGMLHKDLILEMPRATSGKKFELENFYFVGNKPVLLPKSIPVLHRLLEFMKLNPEICIRIDGHINLPNQPPATTDSWHWKLSDDRTKTVYNFLVENEVFEKRMKRKAFANWEMVYPKTTQEKFMKKNRRVEIMIIDCKEQN